MKNNFKVRLIVSICLIIIAILFLSFFDGIPFKIFFGAFAIIAAIELFSFFKKANKPLNIVLAIIELALLVLGSISIARKSVLSIVLVIFGVCSYDVFAYAFGHLFGGKVFPNSRPFPHVSKNKTWEGTFFGLLMSFILVTIVMIGNNSDAYIFWLCGPLAVIGDLSESMLKRTFKVKDSNEIVIKNKYFEYLELFVGGNAGHGGFLDRIDSLAFTCAILICII